ncbi:MAG TPA: glycosyltransferase, partial [Syntrophomonadaceae bacterium]|nr:glycosyltransferase [Syntrophomonadaceae bacterium]
MNFLLQQILRFGITGIINTLIDFAVFNLLVAVTDIHSGWLLGMVNMLAIAVAAANSYFMNRSWTFKNIDEQKRIRQITRFIIATAIGMFLNSIILLLISSMADLIPVSNFVILNTGKVLGAILSASWNFIVYRQWVFNAVSSSDIQVQAPPQIPSMLSIVIPAYNESRRLENRVRSLAQDILKFSFPTEIIIVDDGSKDNTLALGNKLESEFSFVKCISHPINMGKGAAVKTGVMAARGEYIIYADADNTFSFDHICNTFKALKEGNLIVIGTRIGNRQRLEGESFLRRIMGKSFNLLVQLMVLPGITDTQCGLKGFKREIGREIFSHQYLHRFAFDVEILALARELNYPVKPLAITAADCDGSTVNHWLIPLQMAFDIFRVKIGLLFNVYGFKDNSQRKLQAITALSLFAAAMAFRIPWLWQVPRYIDELKEVDLAFNIYLGKILPLHNSAFDIGAMHNYILAGLFGLFGNNIYLPRLYAAVTSALTVVLVYYLGTKLFNRQTGIIAAGLLLTNGMHIMVTHMAWANATTPLFFVLALLTTIYARDYNSGRWLLVSALFWAATLQTHSSAIIYVFIAFIYILSWYLGKKCRIKAGWYWGALLVFTAAYSNMIYYNIVSRLGSLTWIKHKTYTLEPYPGLESYLHNLVQMTVELLRAVSSTYADHLNLLQYFVHPPFLIALLLLVFGISRALRKREYLLTSVIAAGMAVIPWINARYTFYLATRYIMPEIICAILLIALGINTIVENISASVSYRRLVLGITAAALTVWIGLQPLPFYNYCFHMSETNDSNKAALKIMSIVRSDPDRKIVLLDRGLPLLNRPLPSLLALSEQRFLMLPFINRAANKQPLIWSK